jgi:hypothetical protein
MDIHCMLEIWCYLCDHVILDNNNKSVPLPPAVPTASATVQPTCGTPSGTITITTQSELNIAWMVRHISPLIHFSLAQGSYTLYVRNLADPVWPPGSTTTINSIPPPVVPTTASVTQPTCAVQSGSISVTTQSGVEYSLDGTIYQASNTFQAWPRMIIYMLRAPVIILVWQCRHRWW